MYYIFLDEDVAENTLDIIISLTKFENFLLKEKPAVGYIKGMVKWMEEFRKDEHGKLKETVHKNGVGIFNIDAVINAFHKSTIGLLVPYSTSLDHKSWYY